MPGMAATQQRPKPTPKRNPKGNDILSKMLQLEKQHTMVSDAPAGVYLTALETQTPCFPFAPVPHFTTTVQETDCSLDSNSEPSPVRTHW